MIQYNHLNLFHFYFFYIINQRAKNEIPIIISEIGIPITHKNSVLARWSTLLLLNVNAPRRKIIAYGMKNDNKPNCRLLNATAPLHIIKNGRDARGCVPYKNTKAHQYCHSGLDPESPYLERFCKNHGMPVF